MRISDWSSDVCSSDLLIEAESYKDSACSGRCTIGVDGDQSIMDVSQPVRVMAGFTFSQERGTLRIRGKDGFERRGAAAWRRSEEHTSELQSLMRISYAVFCLKKKNTKTVNKKTTSHTI